MPECCPRCDTVLVDGGCPECGWPEYEEEWAEIEAIKAGEP